MLFKKNPAAMPQLIAFTFFSESIEVDSSEICTYTNKLLKAFGMPEHAQLRCLDHGTDQLTFSIGDDFGCLMQRIPVPFPIEKIDPDDPHIDRVRQSGEHWAVVVVTEDHPQRRLNDLIKLSLVLQAMSMSCQPRALMFSPMGVLYRKSEWSNVIHTMIKDKIFPIRHWVGFDLREEGLSVDAVSIYMDELFGLPNTEIVRSSRSEDETTDLLECAVIDTVLNGPLHERGKTWETKTGVRFRVRFTKSQYDPARKVTQLQEMV